MHPPMAQAAHWAGRIVVHQASCRRPPLAVSWPSSRPCRGAHRSCLALCRSPCRRAPVRATARRVTASSAILWRIPGRVAALYHDTPNGQAFRLSRYKRLYRDTPHQLGPTRARCRMPLHAADCVVAHSGRIAGVLSHVVAGHARPCALVSCYVTIQSAVS